MNTLRNILAFALVAVAAVAAYGSATWDAPNYTLATSASISAVGQIRTGSVNVTVQHDTTCTLSISGTPTLSNGNGSTLATAYKLTGPAWVTNQDATWVNAADFLTHNYGITSTGPATTLTLDVQVTPPPNQAPDAGAYSASIVLTVAW